jgi:hypothetical protein
VHLCGVLNARYLPSKEDVLAIHRRHDMHNQSAGPPYGTAPPLDNFMLPKRRFWKDEQKMTSIFSIDFSMVHIPNRVLTPLKSASFEIRMSSFVPPSKIFVWGA